MIYGTQAEEEKAQKGPHACPYCGGDVSAIVDRANKRKERIGGAALQEQADNHAGKAGRSGDEDHADEGWE